LSFAKPQKVRAPWFPQYRPLNLDKGRILEEVLNTNLIPTPQKVLISRNANMSKHCHFHQNYDHNAEECVMFKDKIEEIVHPGHLKRFVH